ncbi:ATP-binding protein, partial [Streptomyces sp. NPDC057638]|uniref:ATP-binding protein n=1 Tax=Streptomyces sp. NPDC057638 TaxID=3346190 RepID=UPI00369EEBD9
MTPRSPAPPAGPTPRRGDLLERAAELSLAREAVQGVAAGRSATVVIHGRRGTGRSALLAELGTAARDAGLWVASLSCRPGDQHRRRGIARDARAASAGARPGEPLVV